MLDAMRLPAAAIWPGSIAAGPGTDGPDGDLVTRLRETARLIDRMLKDDHRERYFEALRLKRDGLDLGNVTARFFADLGAVSAPPS